MSANCPVLRRQSFPLPKNLSRIKRWSVGIGAALLFTALTHAQSWSNIPGWPGLQGYLVPQDFPSPSLSFSASPATLTLWWPSYASNFVIETSSDLASGVWTAETDPNRSTMWDVTVTTMPFDSEQKYFRLRAPLTFAVPIFEFAIFYNSLLEFTWSAAFTLNGPVHANGNIFVGSSANLTFNSTVSTAGGIYKTNWDGHTVLQMTGNITYNGSPGYSTNVATLKLPIGTNSMAPADVRELVNMPPSTEDPLTGLGAVRYYNVAKTVLLVTDTNVSAYFKTSSTDAPISITVTNYGFAPTLNPLLALSFPFLSVTNSFMDQRELSKTVRPTQIDVGVFKDWLMTNPVVTTKFPPNSSPYPDVLYVMDQRTIGGNTNLYSVRLVDGAIIPTNGPSNQPNGWTVATPNPLYVWGNYNLGPGGVTSSSDTSKTYPASLVSDALTILSGNWQDVNSTGSLVSRGAAPTTLNAAIMTGIVYSTDATSNHFSGGVMNMPRLLEDWSGQTLTLNTSFVNLFNSARATNWFINPGVYYFAPTRAFSFDRNFTNIAKLPPLTRFVTVVVSPE